MSRFGVEFGPNYIDKNMSQYKLWANSYRADNERNIYELNYEIKQATQKPYMRSINNLRGIIILWMSIFWKIKKITLHSMIALVFTWYNIVRTFFGPPPRSNKISSQFFFSSKCHVISVKKKKYSLISFLKVIIILIHISIPLYKPTKNWTSPFLSFPLNFLYPSSNGLH
jgi:hypothetical protein